MGLHHEANHGRVFRGLDASNHLDMHKRDSHNRGHIKLNIPKHMKAAARPADSAQTKYSVADKEVVKTVDSVVYVTMSADFTGSVAGYTTLSANTATATADAQSAASSGDASSTQQTAAAQSAASSATQAASSDDVSTSTATVVPTSSSSAANNKSVFLNAPSTATAAATTSATIAAAAVGGTPIAATRSSAATAVGGTPLSATRAASADSGMSTGGKAGLAIGLILGFALIGGLLFFCWRRRKNPNNHEELVDEKHASSIFGGRPAVNNRMSSASDKVPASIRSTHSASTAPRLSLRPVTQFLPNLAADNNRKSGGNTLDVASAAMSEKPKSMWERRAQSNQNPFDDAAILSEKQAHPENPFDESEAHAAEGRTSPNSFKSGQSSGHSQKNSWEGSEPPTPKSLKFGTASAVAVAASGTASAVPPMPKAPAANNVHRVQLDFKPSMEDELELKSGQLVRMLHEYDDGWALCIRMDRTQQGVCPRTCLSKMPVKPRQGPPPAINSRPSSPQEQNGMYPRPLTPTSRERSESAAGEQERPQTPTGGVPARKPVPGQAM